MIKKPRADQGKSASEPTSLHPGPKDSSFGPHIDSLATQCLNLKMNELLLDPMNFKFDTSAMIAGLLFGIVGYWLFREGRRRDQSKILWIGVALMIYPYFFESAKATWAVGIALCGAAYSIWSS